MKWSKSWSRGGRARRRAAIDRRFTLTRLLENAWSAAKQPRNASFLLLFVVVCFTAGPLLRYCKDHEYFAVSGVEVQGTRRIATSRVQAWLGMVVGRSIWRAEPRDLEETLRRHPAVADARVRRVLPDRIEVTIDERQADVVVRDERGFFLADVEGVLFEHALPGASDLPALPIVTVARSSDPADSETEAEARTVLGDARDLSPRVLAEAIALAARLEVGQGGIGVSELTIGAPGPAGEPDLLVFSTDGQLAVRLGWGQWDEKLSSLARVVAHAQSAGHASRGTLSGQLDVRDPEAVVARWAYEKEAA